MGEYSNHESFSAAERSDIPDQGGGSSIENIELTEFESLLGMTRGKQGLDLQEIFFDGDRVKRNQTNCLANEAHRILKNLRSGEILVHTLNPFTKSNNWHLARAGTIVSSDLVEVLKVADRPLPRRLRSTIGRGVLVPSDDGLPGIGGSQSWRWLQKKSAGSDRPPNNEAA